MGDKVVSEIWHVGATRLTVIVNKLKTLLNRVNYYLCHRPESLYVLMMHDPNTKGFQDSSVDNMSRISSRFHPSRYRVSLAIEA
jgi:hypothetical protein